MPVLTAPTGKHVGFRRKFITSVFVFLHTGHAVQESDPGDR